jgi:hypothetical protein
LFKNKRLCGGPSSLRILFGRMYLAPLAAAMDTLPAPPHKTPCMRLSLAAVGWVADAALLALVGLISSAAAGSPVLQPTKFWAAVFAET